MSENIENEYIEGSRLKREGVPENRDLTVLLVNDQNRDYNTKIGRYHSVKPLIGLLTSTARTFIQDGVTTEFATQILGTTLDNGRIYAQLLTKSSLVLYNKPSNVDDPFLVQPTRVHSAFDGQWNVKQDLGFIDPDKFVLKNTDYLAPSSKTNIVYASKAFKEPLKVWNSPSAPGLQFDNQIFEEPTARRVQAYNQIPRYEVYNYLDGPAIESEKKLEFIVEPSILNNVSTLHRQNKAYESVIESLNINSKDKDDTINESNIVKVKPNYDLPTFTIKNEFSPIFYYIDNVESRRPPQYTLQQTKTPKKLFGQKSEPSPKKTFTYAGFADFTTVVGDTVIIFKPNTETSRPPNPDEVNVFPSARHVDKLATKITFLSADIPVATATFKPQEVIQSTKAITTSSTTSSDIKENPVYSNEDSLKKESYNEDDKMSGAVSVQYNNGFDFNLDIIQPSEASFTTTESTRAMDELQIIHNQEYNTHATEPLINIQPSTLTLDEPKETVVTESNIKEVFTNSEEETENTAAEVTEKFEEAEEVEDEEEEEEKTTAMEELKTTTESGHSDESYEDIETTTETKHDKHEYVYCTDGLETQSTMTTAFKTLTYLTTYFIPLENTGTTTSVESNIVFTSDTGYFTNIVCKTNLIIEPTAVTSVELKSTEQFNLERPETSTEFHSTQNDVFTENSLKITSIEKETITTIQDDEDVTTSDEGKNTTTYGLFNEQTVAFTTEQASTSRMEVSVNTESILTEKPVFEETDNANIAENEIDLIYKTLYTTYTYFTTFFGEHTSSVVSHKSVVTNIITSTVDLSNIDPSLLGAFDEDEIAPTGVGIGQPTETFAINSIIDLVKNKDVIESVEKDGSYSSQTPTPSLGDDVIASIKPDAVKTYFTTYTFFTTIYVGTDANVCSRSEVYTNYVGPDELIPTKSNPLVTEQTRAQFDFRNCKQVKREQEVLVQNNPSNSAIKEEYNFQELGDSKKGIIQPTPIEVDMLLSIESNPLESENSYVTDVKSSSSKGERKIIDNNNIILDDQISSESNIEEILPSPTLLLQTSYTTFTYFTTMYIGKDSSKVKSRLETITNVVTETITPKTEPEEESNLPITYYTTFTYWTTLYKDKSTTITSREEIVSNVVTPVMQSFTTLGPIDTTPIDVNSVLPPKDLEAQIKPSIIEDSLEQDDGKATFYTTYTYFTTFYAGNISKIRSSLETVTNIVDNTRLVEGNQLGRKVGGVPVDKNLIQDNSDKINIVPSSVKEEIQPTNIPDITPVSSTVLLGTYIDNLFAEVKPLENSQISPEPEKKILFSQIAVISGNSTIVTSDNKTLEGSSTSTSSLTSITTSTEESIISPTPDAIESSVAELETTTEYKPELEEEEDNTNPRKKSRLTFTTKKPSFTPVIIPFASRNRPTFSPKRVPLLSSATTITRADSTPTITATPTLKSVRTSGFGSASRKQVVSPASSGPGRRFSGRSSSINSLANVPYASRSGGFARGSIQPTSRRSGFRSSSFRSNSLDYASRSVIPRIRPTASSRLKNSRQSSTLFFPLNEQGESETSATQLEEIATESLGEITELPSRATNSPLLKFRKLSVARQPGTAILPRSTTPSAKRSGNIRGRTTTTTRRTTRSSTSNPLLSLRRQRPNSLFPKRNLFKQPEPELEEEIRENEQKFEDDEELLEEEEFEEDNDYESSDRKEQQVATPSTPASKKNSKVQIRPFAFKKRTKRQVDYGNRKYTNFRRPGSKSASTRRPEHEPETESPVSVTQKQKTGRYNSRTPKTTTATTPKSSSRQSFTVRGESKTSSTTALPAYRRGRTGTSSRTTTHSSRPKAPRLSNKSSDRSRVGSSRSSTSRSRTRTTTSRASSRQRNSFENLSAERYRQDSYNNLLHDGKITITHQVPVEVTVPVVNGRITEYKNLLSAKPSAETLLLNQVSTSIGPLGNHQLVLAVESTELAENGATKITKYVLHETPTTTVIFTPTTIRGRKTSFSHVLPSTVFNVEPVVQTISPEINANVPLANLLLSQLLLGNQQPAINPLLALQGQALLPQQQVVQTPITEYKTRTTTFVTTVTDARETVLPITFRGKAILTTIVDPTTNVITATEFITDTVVTTPTALAPQPQLNSLLLPLLLQQQQQQQQILSLPTANPLLGLAQPDLNLLPNNNLNLNNDIYSNSPKPNILSDLNSNEDFSEDSEEIGDDNLPLPPPPSSSHTRHRQRTLKASHPKMTSVITLYVSGKFPGEFSTVLSTIVTDDTQTVRKREAIYFNDAPVTPTMLPSVENLVGSQPDILENTMEYNEPNSRFDTQSETQSLESIVGKISDHIRYDASPTYVVKLGNPSTISKKEQKSVDDVS
ncbi:unnamed protein product [Parnassius apollo]|uniref:(apollo) hypothetical protein n=1 Tax=Parnassius apollo TaxID=110799 RepID=A0A8S3XRD0_PARAO|nr:unnamed protein product [Parnassius apollo]